MATARKIFAGLAWLYLACVVIQFALAGLGLPQLGERGMAVHSDFGYIALHMTPILLIIAGVIGRVGGRLVWLTVTMALIAFAQPIWVTAFRGGWVASLHVVGAGAILVMSLLIARQGMLAARESPAQPG